MYTVTFDQLNASLLDKIINFSPKKKTLFNIDNNNNKCILSDAESYI